MSGLKELEFWDMSIGEVARHIDTYYKLKKTENQEKASNNYILASLIVKGFSITMGAKDTYPTIEEVYPNLFNDIKADRENAIQESKTNLSVLRFKQFAQNHNKKYEEVLTDNGRIKDSN